jgi:AmpD protein
MRMTAASWRIVSTRTIAFVDPGSGLIAPARHVASPNRDERPPGTLPELIVVHNISLPPDEYGGQWIDRLFTNTLPPNAPDVHPFFATVMTLQVSSHLLIRRDGEYVQYVPFHLRAWHAGASSYRGRERCNDFSIGIELEGTEDQPFEDAQYSAVTALIKSLQKKLPIRDVAAHSEVAPGRKTDPGAHFDWPRLLAALAAA